MTRTVAQVAEHEPAETAVIGADSVSATEKVNTPTDSSTSSVTVIEPKPGWQAIDVAELWRYRELIYFLTWRDIKVRYKQTVLGAAWAVLQPLMMMTVFTFISQMGNLNKGVSTSVPIFIYAALLPWQFFSAGVTQSGQSLVSGANLISKVYFPRMIVPIAAVGAGLVDFVVSFCVMLVLMGLFGVLPGWPLVLAPLVLAAFWGRNWTHFVASGVATLALLGVLGETTGWPVVFLPFLVIGVVMTAIGVGSLLAALTVAYRDFRYVVPFLVQMWMFASPVIYPVSRVTERIASRGLPDEFLYVYFLNPLAGFVGGFRWALLGEPLDIGCLMVSVTVSCVLLVIGAFYFRRVERRFADIV